MRLSHPPLPRHAGYCSYAPSKWALRGLADSLHNELQGTGVRVSVAYPPDTGGHGDAPRSVGWAWCWAVACLPLACSPPWQRHCYTLSHILPHSHPTTVKLTLAADTPGYAQENATKPPLCTAVNAALGSGLFTADKASAVLLL